MLEGGDVRVLKFIQELIAEYGVDVLTFIALTTLLRVLLDDFILVKGGRTLRDGRRLTGVAWADKRYWSDERVLRRLQDNPEVTILDPFVGTLN